MRHDPTRTFETLIVGASNVQAILAARHAISRSGVVLVRGPGGCGKTHLLHAVATELLRQRPSARIEMLTARELCDRWVDAIRGARAHRFRAALRSCDALLVDHLEDLWNMTACLAELAETARVVAQRGPVVLVVNNGRRPTPRIDRTMRALPNATTATMWLPSYSQRLGALIRNHCELDSTALRPFARRARTVPEACAAVDRAWVADQLRPSSAARR